MERFICSIRWYANLGSMWGDNVGNVPDRCYSCEHFQMDRHLEYYNYPYCGKNGHEIKFGSENGQDRMKWCPLLTDAEKTEALVNGLSKAINDVLFMLRWSNDRENDPNHFCYCFHVLVDRANDAL